MHKLEHVLPADIEKTSFRMIGEELAERKIEVAPELAPVIYRVIHTTADFEYAETMAFSGNVMQQALDIFSRGPLIVTDTTMVYSGINKRALEALGGEARCFIADPEIAAEAKARGVTRSTAAMERAMREERPTVFAVGNAPTALISLYEGIQKGYRPALVIGVPVGFVNVVQAKEMIMETDVPWIVNRGRKGGSNVAAAVCNAILYQLGDDPRF
ncbi:MAG: precorrin-8X methylmutase [Lachnospiraceae bacterium]|nr:precorrin-8X methylmutase [Lachnospiraceae bacterium]